MVKKLKLPESALTPRQVWLQRRHTDRWKRLTGRGGHRRTGAIVPVKASVPTPQVSAAQLRKRRDSTRAKRARATSLAMRNAS